MFSSMWLQSSGRVHKDVECQFIFVLSTCGIITPYYTDSAKNQAESGGSNGEPCLSEYRQNDESASASVVPGATWPASAVVAGRVLRRGLRGGSLGWSGGGEHSYGSDAVVENRGEEIVTRLRMSFEG